MLNATAVSTQVLNRYWDGNLPVDVHAIAEAMGASVSSEPLDYSGEISKDDSGAVHIKINSNDSANRQRFTLAHELGHWQMGHMVGVTKLFRDVDPTKSPNDWREREANSFAANLLMPKNMLRWVVLTNNVTDPVRLQSIFGASMIFLTHRLRNTLK